MTSVITKHSGALTVLTGRIICAELRRRKREYKGDKGPETTVNKECKQNK